MYLSSRRMRLTVSSPYKSGSCIHNHSLLAICTSLYCEFGDLPRIASFTQTVFHLLSLQGCNDTPTYTFIYQEPNTTLTKYASILRGLFFKIRILGWNKRVIFRVEVPSSNILWLGEAYFWRLFCVCLCMCVCVCACAYVYVLARVRGNVRCCINTIYFTVHLVFMSWMKFGIAIFEYLMRCM